MVMFSKILHRLGDITRIHHRAAFADVEKRIAPRKSAFLTLAGERYSCRSYSEQPVSQEDIKSILEAARLAPTAMDKQPVHVWTARSESARDRLKEATQYTYGAPVVFIVGCRPEDAWVRKYDGKNGAETDAAIVGTHLMMEAADLGLGSVWVGSFDPAMVHELFPETECYEIVALFPVGHPAKETAGGPSANHGKRIPMDRFASEL